jgi:hypothetical protein
MGLNMPLVRGSIGVAEVRCAQRRLRDTDRAGEPVHMSPALALDSISDTCHDSQSPNGAKQSSPCFRKSLACIFKLALSVSTIAALFIGLRERQNRSIELQCGASSAARCPLTHSELHKEYSIPLSGIRYTA